MDSLLNSKCALENASFFFFCLHHLCKLCRACPHWFLIEKFCFTSFFFHFAIFKAEPEVNVVSQVAKSSVLL